MALIQLTQFEQLVTSYIPLVGSALDFQREKQIDKAIVSLYNETDALAVMVTQTVAAFLWWAAHMGSAAADAQGYADQIKDAITKANMNSEETWSVFLTQKYPADLRKLYADVKTLIDDATKKLAASQAAGLKKLEAEVAALETWKTKSVDPVVTGWNKFYANWSKTYRPAVKTLVQWQTKPKILADLLFPSIFDAWVTAVTGDKYTKAVTRAETAMMSTWVNDPQKVYNNVLTWLVTG